MGSYRNEMERRERLARENGKRLAKKRHPFADPRPAAQPGVVVKGLEWETPAACEHLSRAETDVGVYRAWTHHEANGRWFWSLDGYHKVSGEVSSEAEAKAAAQADYEHRILSALAAPVSQEPVARSDVFDWLETELRAVDCRYRGDPAYDHDAYWFRDRALNIVAEARQMFASPQPLTEGEPSEAEVELERALKDVLSSLVAAHSLLSRSPKTAAPSNKMFDQMLKDYAASIKRGRAALLAAKSKGGQVDG